MEVNVKGESLLLRQISTKDLAKDQTWDMAVLAVITEGNK